MECLSEVHVALPLDLIIPRLQYGKRVVQATKSWGKSGDEAISEACHECLPIAIREKVCPFVTPGSA